MLVLFNNQSDLYSGNLLLVPLDGQKLIFHVIANRLRYIEMVSTYCQVHIAFLCP